MPGPADTSVRQYLLLYSLNNPIPVAIVYLKMSYQIDASLNSWPRNSAAVKATTVCPDGKELLDLLSGLSILVIPEKDKSLIKV